MPSVFLYSDPHFSHEGVCRFMRADGVTKLRPWDSAEEMDKDMVECFNDTVRPKDKVYFLGDIAMRKQNLSILERLHGDKVLIKGNHDIMKLKDYSKYFRDIRGYHVMNGMILSHIPIHPDSLSRFGTNIHGHTHEKRVLLPDGTIDVRYHSVCVEQTNFAPILFENVVKRIEAEGGTIGFRNGNGSIM